MTDEENYNRLNRYENLTLICDYGYRLEMGTTAKQETGAVSCLQIVC